MCESSAQAEFIRGTAYAVVGKKEKGVGRSVIDLPLARGFNWPDIHRGSLSGSTVQAQKLFTSPRVGKTLPRYGIHAVVSARSLTL
jgi:hypothetical protein